MLVHMQKSTLFPIFIHLSFACTIPLDLVNIFVMF